MRRTEQTKYSVEELFNAIEHNNDIEKIRSIITGIEDIDQMNEFGETALIVASERGNDAVVRLLLEAGANTDWPYAADKTALIVASAKGKEEVVRILLKAGADVNNAPRFGLFAEKTALYWASRIGNVAIVRMLLAAGADVNKKVVDGFNAGETSLAAAFSAGHLDVVSMLIAKGANVNIVDKYGYAVLSEVVSNNNIEFVRIFLAAGADLNLASTAGNYTGWTPLMIASFGRNHKMVRLLLEAGADVNLASTAGIYNDWTPLMIASENADIEMIKLLVSYGADTSLLSEIEQNIYAEAIAAGNTEEFGTRLEATGKALAQISPDRVTDERLKAEANLWKRLPSDILALITSYATSAQGPHKLTSDSILAYATKGAKSVISNVFNNALNHSIMRSSQALPVSATGIVYDSDNDSELSAACSVSAAVPLRVQKTNLNDPVSVSDVSHLDYHDGIEEAKGYDARSEACSSSSSAAAFANDGVAEAKEYDFQSVASSSSSDTTKASKSQTAKLEQERGAAKADDGLSK